VKILVLASTVPAHEADQVPRFVLDQALAMTAVDESLALAILAPHTRDSSQRVWPQDESPDGRVTQHRFHYAPRRWEVLTERGIMPAISENPWRMLLLPMLIAAEWRATWSVVRRERPDVIYAHWFTPQALVAKSVSRLTGVPYGFTTHASDVVVWHRFGPLGRAVVRSGVRRAAFMTAVSRQTASKLLSFFSEKARPAVASRLHIIPMGTDVPLVALPPGDPRHVYIVARLVEKKGIHHLLDAWPAVVAAVPDARLTIAGSGSWEQRLRDQAEKLGLDVDFPGYVTGQAKQRVVEAAGVCVQPSVIASDGDADGLPVAALEALAAGRVVVASDASGAQDLLTSGTDGWLVPAGDSQALATSLIAAMTMSGGEQEAMIEAARATAETIAWPHIAAVHRSVILGVNTHESADTPDQL
jgi:glycosyltransferase involved in cell wall biosynthesis